MVSAGMVDGNPCSIGGFLIKAGCNSFWFRISYVNGFQCGVKLGSPKKFGFLSREVSQGLGYLCVRILCIVP
jgi:hypothetical protein